MGTLLATALLHRLAHRLAERNTSRDSQECIVIHGRPKPSRATREIPQFQQILFSCPDRGDEVSP